MGQPVKLSDALVLDARLAGESAERSLASQIEFWAQLGRSIELVLRLDDVLRLKHRGGARPLSECLRSVNTKEGRRRLARSLAAQPFPHFEPAADRPGFLVRVDQDGTRTIGRFVNRKLNEAASRQLSEVVRRP